MVGVVAPAPILDPITGKTYPLPSGGFFNAVLAEGFVWVDVGPAYVLARPDGTVIKRTDGKLFYQLKATGHGGILGDIIDERQVIALVAAIFTAGATSAAVGEGAAASAGPVQLSGPGAGAASTAASSIPAIGGTGTALGAAASLIGSAGSTASSTAEQLSGPAADNIDAAGSTVSSTLGSALSPVKDAIASAKATLSDVFGPVGDLLHSITGTLNDINSSIIQPIVQPLKALIEAQKTLSAAISRDLHDGVRGLLNLPGDIAGAFNSVDATIQRSLAMWATQSAASQSAVFGALLTGEHGATLGTSTEAIRAALAPTAGSFDAPRHFQLDEGIDLAAYKEKIRADQEEIAKGEGLAASLVQSFARSVAALEAIALQREPYNELWREEVARAFGIKRFDVGTVLALLQRGELDATEAKDELRVQGYSDSRANALIEQARLLPDTQRALALFAHRWIDNVAAQTMLRAQGWSDADSELLLASAATELGPDVLMELTRRGLITPDESAVALERQGFRQFDVARYMATRWRLLGLADVIALHDRLGAGGDTNAFPTLAAGAPDELQAYAERLGIDRTSSAVLWSNHWRLLSPELAVMAFFRGYLNAPQLNLCLAQAAIPPELRQNFIDLQRPLIPFRSIPNMLAHGVMTESEAIDALRARGFSDRDANLLIHSGKGAAAPSQAQAVSDLHGLTRGTVLALYDAGTIQRDEARATLSALGLAEHAVNAELDLHDVRSLHAERMAEIDATIARARSGELEMSEADAQLVALNLTQTELARAQAKLRRDVRSGLKMPSDAQIMAMWKKAIIDDDEALNALQLSGYSELWAQRLLELEGARGSKAQGSSGAAHAAP